MPGMNGHCSTYGRGAVKASSGTALMPLANVFAGTPRIELGSAGTSRDATLRGRPFT
jgi:hypothetical protein